MGSRLYMARVHIVLILFYYVGVSRPWDIRISNANDVILRHVSLYYLRAFLCVETTTNVTTPTLLESTWPENILVIKPRPFPSNYAHVGDDKDCRKIHQARSTDVDGNGYLWILDAGNDLCPAKIIIIDLEHKNTEILRATLVGHHGLKLTSIKINPSTVGTIDHMAYITADNGQYLLAFFLHTKKWSEIYVSSGDDWPTDQVYPSDIAFTLDSRIYIGDTQGNLFVTDTMNTANSTSIQVNRLGMLLDRPRGLITDEKGHVYYIIQRFGAVVRWNPTRTLNAEGHEVLKFHSGTIIQILFGVHGSVWIALETMSTRRDHCIRLMFHFTNNALL